MKKVGKPKKEGWVRLHLMLKESTADGLREIAGEEARSISAQADRFLAVAIAERNRD